jgi:hypothetical protein
VVSSFYTVKNGERCGISLHSYRRFVETKNVKEENHSKILAGNKRTSDLKAAGHLNC